MPGNCYTTLKHHKMKKKHKEILEPKLKVLHQKIKKLLIEEGLGDFELDRFKFTHQESKGFLNCDPETEEPCVVFVSGGYKLVCVPKGSCR